jgi:hypothetical protein
MTLKTKGQLLQQHFTDFVTLWGSTVVITPVVRATGNYVGYEPVVDTLGTPVTTKGVPSNFTTDADGKIIGRLETGDITMIVRYSEAVDRFYLVTWASRDWIVKEIKDTTFQDAILVRRLTLSRKLL